MSGYFCKNAPQIWLLCPQLHVASVVAATAAAAECDQSRDCEAIQVAGRPKRSQTEATGRRSPDIATRMGPPVPEAASRPGQLLLQLVVARAKLDTRARSMSCRLTATSTTILLFVVGVTYSAASRLDSNDSTAASRWFLNSTPTYKSDKTSQLAWWPQHYDYDEYNVVWSAIVIVIE